MEWRCDVSCIIIDGFDHKWGMRSRLFSLVQLPLPQFLPVFFYEASPSIEFDESFPKRDLPCLLNRNGWRDMANSKFVEFGAYLCFNADVNEVLHCGDGPIAFAMVYYSLSFE